MKWSLAAVCLLVLFVTSHGKPPKCPPAEEGQPYNITHSTSIRHNLRDLSWRFQFPTGKHEEVSYCYHDETICFDLFDEYTTYRRLDGDAFTCHLEIGHVNNQHRGLVVEFVATNESVGHSQTLFVCEMEVYLKPQGSQCHAVEVAPKHVEVTCNTKKVYPQASFELLQVEMSSDHSEKINQSLIDQSHKQTVEDGATYFSSTWKTSTLVNRAGKYVFFATITPGLSPEAMENIVIKPAHTSIEVTAGDRIVQLPSPKWPVNICRNGESTIVVTCKAQGFKSQIRFFWKKGHSSVLPTQYTSTSIQSSNYSESYGLYEYESTFEFNVTEADNNILLTCGADETDSRYLLEKPLQAESKLSLRWPPRAEPKFMTSGGEEVTASSISSYDDAPISLACLVEGGNPPVSHTSVTCDKLPGKEVQERNGQEQRRHFFEDANSVKFKLTGVPGESYMCTCIASHQTECYHKRRTLTISLFNNSKEQIRADKSNTTVIVIWAVIPLVIAIAIVLLIFYAVRKLRKRRKTCKNATMYCSSSDIMYETVDEPIDQDIKL